jgi:two-component SAPR family response regulator
VSRLGRAARAVGAILVLLTVVIGVPVLLVVFVGNPWPGRTRVELGDEVAVVAGVLAVLAWLVWARFVVAVAVELRDQVVALRAEPGRGPIERIEVVAPTPVRGGIGVLAQRLVAAALIILPLVTRAAPSHAGVPDTLLGARAPATVVVDADRTPQVSQPERAAPAAERAPPAGRSVVVAPGDTLIGLARTHLGEPDRWREIFELNRDRPQADGGRLVTPSLIHPGWRLRLPVPAEPAPYLAAETITIEPGNTLWELSHDRLADAGAPHDDSSVLTYVEQVIAVNDDVVEDPDLIYPGERFDFPAVGEPPPAPPAHHARRERPPRREHEQQHAEHRDRDERDDPVETVTTTAMATMSETPMATAAATTTSTATPGPTVGRNPSDQEVPRRRSPAPIGIGQATMLTAGVLALLAARRRIRLRAAQPRARVPEPPPEMVATERQLRRVDAGEQLLRVDIAVRAAAASLVDGAAQVVVVRVGAHGDVELTLTAAATLPTPWMGEGASWSLPGAVPIELLAEPARSVGAPCVALTQIGVDPDGRDVLVDLEAVGLLAIDAPADQADAVVRGIAATLASSLFAEVATLIGAGIDESAFLDHRHAHHVAHVDDALELAATLLGTTSSARHSTFVLRARHTGGEAWEPAVVLAGSDLAGEMTEDLVRTAACRRGGLAMVVAGGSPGAPWSLRFDDRRWTLEPLGIELKPVGLSDVELEEIHDVLEHADAALLSDEPLETTVDDLTWSGEEFSEPDWTLLVRLLGPVEVVDRDGNAAHFERSKTLELIAWLALHREHSTRVGARTALWELDVRDATFANVVSEARRAMARLLPPPDGEEWLGRTLTDLLPLHAAVLADVDLVRARLEWARLQPPQLAVETLRPAVAMIRDMPFAGTGYLWPDAEGITSNLVLLATGAATELAGHCLSMGDVGGVFWATGQGLKVLPGHEELIALRMRAHAKAGDLSGVRLEWETYERVLNADPWSDGEPAPKLAMLRRELLSP